MHLIDGVRTRTPVLMVSPGGGHVGLAVGLQGAGFPVRLVETGPAAVAAVLACPPAVVFLDAGGLGGVAPRLQATPAGRGLLILGLGGAGPAPDGARADREPGIDWRLPGPVAVGHLVEVLSRFARLADQCRHVGRPVPSPD